MNENLWIYKENNTSKLLALILRHKLNILNIKPQKGGWVEIEELLKAIKLFFNIDISKKQCLDVVFQDPKKRFSVKDNKFIRANYGHSCDIEFDYRAATPPKYLYHGTSKKSLESILQEGIKPMSRQFVHLSLDIPTAIEVGKRHGEPIVLRIESLKMSHENYIFYQVQESKIWLTKFVPSKFIKIL